MAGGRAVVKPRPRKTLMMFVLSLILGGVGVYYAKYYIEEQIAFYKNQLEQTPDMVELIVPTRGLLRGEVVTPEMLSLREIPVQYADSNAVSASNYDVALGQRIDFDIDEGRPLLWAHLEGGLSPTFSGRVPEGLRALTVRVDEINSISGFLQPKDRVDLLMSHGSGLDQEILALMDRVEVIATGVQTLVDKNVSGGKRSFSTITVQVTPEEAQRITLAQQVGKVTAVLRNPDDDAPLGAPPMSMARLLGIEPKTLDIIAAPEPARKVIRKTAPDPPGIEYIIGGS